MEQKIDNLSRIWLRELSKHSEYVEGKIARGIEENRKGIFRLRLLDGEGKPLPCEKVRVKQISHEFKFGAPLFVLDQLGDEGKNQAYRELFSGVFNYAVAPLYRKDLEPQRGKYRFEKTSPFVWRRPPLDTIVEYCREKNMRMKGHCLVYNSFNPEWLQNLSYREMNISIEEYMEAIANRYGKDMEDIDVINEMFSIYKNCYAGNGERNLPVANERDHVAKMFTMAKRYFPHTRLFWNEGSFETFGLDRYKGERSQYYLMLQEQIENGIPVEGIGMQFHMFATQGTEFFNMATSSSLCNPLRMFDVFDCYGQFRLPIHISELSVPSYTNGEEDEAMQAEIVQRLFRIFFSQKQVESIVWWNVADCMAFQGEDGFMAGLLRKDLTPKPAYDAIKNLLEKEWHTEFTTRNEEFIEFIGFYGDYEITYTQDGKECSAKVRLYKENTGYDNRLMEPRTITVKA